MNEDKASRYQRLRRRAAFASAGWSLLLLTMLLVTGLSPWLRNLAQAAAGGGALLTRSVYAAALIAVHSAGHGPLAFYQDFVLERRYGLSRQSARRWVLGWIQSRAVVATVGAVAVNIMYATLELAPAAWWLLSASAFAVLLVIVATAAPVVLLPIVARVTPLSSPSLRSRLVALAQRCGAGALDAYQWGMGPQTRPNAMLAGFGAGRRVLVSDTLLAECSDDEIEIVLAHEIGHHLHGDLWKSLGFETAILAVGLWMASWMLGPWVNFAGLRTANDVATLPLVVLALLSVSLVFAPAAHAWSRARERRADRFALSATGNPAAFVSAVRRLSAQNMAEERPSVAVRWLFHSHPTAEERIAAAEAFRRAMALGGHAASTVDAKAARTARVVLSSESRVETTGA
ncbi:MAG: hypothetical protein FJ207_15850 [Gemmatimonadetes bacterium]|nr:hypothetical protein [Gemmatimonadota bacterium]